MFDDASLLIQKLFFISVLVTPASYYQECGLLIQVQFQKQSTHYTEKHYVEKYPEKAVFMCPVCCEWLNYNISPKYIK